MIGGFHRPVAFVSSRMSESHDAMKFRCDIWIESGEQATKAINPDDHVGRSG